VRFLSVHVEPSILARLIFWLHLGVVPLLESQDPATRFAERRHPPNRAYLEGSLAVSAGGAGRSCRRRAVPNDAGSESKAAETRGRRASFVLPAVAQIA
jgi:hypothetical protein